jgi:hypothetical protein
MFRHDCSKKFEAPILAGREPWATDSQKAKAEAASTELSNVVNQVRNGEN